MRRILTFIVAVAAGTAIGLAIGAPWAGALAWLQANWPLADAAIGLALGVLVGLAWLVFDLSGFVVDLTVIRLSVTGLGEIQVGLTRQERGVLWTLFIELATRITIQPLPALDGSLAEAMASLHDFFAVAREQLSQAPIRDAAKGEDTAQALVLHVLNGELRPFLTHWRPRLLAALAGGATETSWAEAPACRAALEQTRLRVLDVVWQLGGQLGVSHLAAILPERPSPAAAAPAAVRA